MKNFREQIRKILYEALTADIVDYKSRVDAGKRKEAKIMNQLRKKGIKIDDPTPEEDMYDKIDGWMYDAQGNKASVQIKFRESGDDIIFEIMKDFDKQDEGRDLISKADLYLVVDRRGVGRLLPTHQIKSIAKKFVTAVPAAIEKNPDKRSWEGNGWEVKLTHDRARGQRKMMGYFSPRIFNVMKTWNFKL